MERKGELGEERAREALKVLVDVAASICLSVLTRVMWPGKQSTICDAIMGKFFLYVHFVLLLVVYI